MKDNNREQKASEFRKGHYIPIPESVQLWKGTNDYELFLDKFLSDFATQEVERETKEINEQLDQCREAYTGLLDVIEADNVTIESLEAKVKELESWKENQIKLTTPLIEFAHSSDLFNVGDSIHEKTVEYLRQLKPND